MNNEYHEKLKIAILAHKQITQAINEIEKSEYEVVICRYDGIRVDDEWFDCNLLEKIEKAKNEH